MVPTYVISSEIVDTTDKQTELNANADATVNRVNEMHCSSVDDTSSLARTAACSTYFLESVPTFRAQGDADAPSGSRFCCFCQL